MSDTDKVFSDLIAEIYDDYLVPLIFEEYAADLAKRVAGDNPQAVLETAAGSGVVTRALAPLLADTAQYCVTDLNQPMLDRAASRQPPDANISWQQADALELPFEDETFDVVCCQFGVMFFPDRIAGFREARRVLRPGGRFVFNSWDHIDHNIFARVVTDVAAEFFPDDPPRFLARTPHGYHDTGSIAEELAKAGFRNIDITTRPAVSTAPVARDPAYAYCKGTPLRNEIEARDSALLDEITDRAAHEIAAEFGPGPVSAKIQAHIARAEV
jgi:ubiquinone/menaquinone biosynthesis C-methylase UbiE